MAFDWREDSGWEDGLDIFLSLDSFWLASKNGAGNCIYGDVVEWHGSVDCIASCGRSGNGLGIRGRASAITSLACVFHFVYIFCIEC